MFEEADTSDYRKVLGHPFGVDRDHLGAGDRVMTWVRDDDGEPFHLPFHPLPGIIPEGAPLIGGVASMSTVAVSGSVTHSGAPG